MINPKPFTYELYQSACKRKQIGGINDTFIVPGVIIQRMDNTTREYVLFAPDMLDDVGLPLPIRLYLDYTGCSGNPEEIKRRKHISPFKTATFEIIQQYDSNDFFILRTHYISPSPEISHAFYKKGDPSMSIIMPPSMILTLIEEKEKIELESKQRQFRSSVFASLEETTREIPKEVGRQFLQSAHISTKPTTTTEKETTTMDTPVQLEVEKELYIKKAQDNINKAKEIDDKVGMISDGYHTFDELYHHRAMLFASLCMTTLKNYAWKSLLHSDPNDSMYTGMFIVGVDLPDIGQASYHYNIDPYWSVFKGIKELDRAPKFDGHTPEQAIERIYKFALEYTEVRIRGGATPL